MSKKPAIIGVGGERLESMPKVPEIAAIHPWGGKVLIEDLRPEEILQAKIHVPESMKIDDAPQAYIVELGPKVPEDSGLKVGQRVIWQQTAIPVKDPRQKRRVRALVEIHQIIAIVEEEGVQE